MRRILKSIFFEARQVPREFFAPFVGAIKGIRREYRLIERLESIERHDFNKSLGN